MGTDVEMDPNTELLQRYARLDLEADAGKAFYVQTTKDRMRIEAIGQRLLTGRLAIAQMACEGVKKIFESVRTYATEKKIHPAPGVEYPLLEVPQLKHVFDVWLVRLERMMRYSADIQKELCANLKENRVPSRRLVEEIAVAKIKALEVAIEAGHRLEQEVGSFVLMEGSGFEHKDVLLCCKFAEGDSRILQQKMVRDNLKWVSDLSWCERIVGHLLLGGPWNRGRMRRALGLARTLQNNVENEGGDGIKAWNNCFNEVYEYSDFLCERYIQARVGTDATLAKM